MRVFVQKEGHMKIIANNNTIQTSPATDQQTSPQSGHQLDVDE
ncbi:MAG: hypothetical protein ACD_62C00355G0001 [uncultured bacterium]|nr:MAG: hypothetical protein ACD_62C00355G0001 [uncultured bacterium]HLD45466.1 hypothetical protein [bacterium]